MLYIKSHINKGFTRGLQGVNRGNTPANPLSIPYKNGAIPILHEELISIW